MSRRQSIPSNLFYRKADPLPPLFPEPHEGDIYFNTTHNVLRVYREIEDAEGKFAWQDLNYATSGHTHPSVEQYIWRYDSATTMTDPGIGGIKTNTPSGEPSQQAAIHEITAAASGGVDASRTLSALRTGDYVFFQQANVAANWGHYTLAAPPTDNGTWFLLAITPVEQHGAPIAKNQDVIVRFTFGTEGGGGGGGGGGGMTSSESDQKYVDVVGDSMTGPLKLAGNPSIPLEAANKGYVDARTPKVSTTPTEPPNPTVGDIWIDTDEPNRMGYTQSESDQRYLQLIGGELTGFVTAHANPSLDLHLATKKYVDTSSGTGVPTSRSVIAGTGLAGGGALTGDVTLNVASANSDLTVGADAITVNAAPRWSAGQTITLTGKVSGTSTPWDGSAPLSFATTLAAGTIVDADVFAAANIQQSKILNLPTDLAAKLPLSKVTTAPTAPVSPAVGDLWIDTDEPARVGMTISEADAKYVPLGGGTLTGFLSAHADPSSAMHVATKYYVDSVTGVSLNRQVIAGAGLTGGGTLTADVTLNVAGDANLFVDTNLISVLSAPKWTSSRTLTLGGTLSGSTTFDGSAAIPTLTVAIVAGSIVNADINTSAAIAQTKIANLPTDLSSKLPASKITTSTEAPATPGVGDIWIDTDEPARIGMTLAEADAKYLQKAGGTLTGFLFAHADPSLDLHMATKKYVDSVTGVSLNRQVIAGAGLTGGGTLTSDVTLNVVGDATTLSVAADQVAVIAAPKWVSSRTLTLDGDVTGAVSFDGSAAIPNLTVAIAPDKIVNSDINSAAAIATSKIAGLDTALTGKLAASKVTTSDEPPATPATGDLWIDTNEPARIGITLSEGDIRYLQKTGGTLTGFVTAHADPSSDYHLATKHYVDSAAGVSLNRSVVAGFGLTGGGVLTSDVTLRVVGDANLSVTEDLVSVLSAPKWTTNRTLALGGVLSGNINFDGGSPLSTLVADIVDGSIVNADISATADIVQTKVLGLVADLAAKLTQATADGLYLSKGGGTLTGPLVLSADPSIPTHAASKNYVDTRNPRITAAPTAPVAPATGDFWVDTDEPARIGMTLAEADAKYVQLGGGTLTGFLSAHANPSSAMHVATKDYVDNMPAGVPSTRTVSAGNGLTGGGDLSINRTISALAANGSISVAVGGLSVLSAPQWTTGRTITLTGDTTGVSAAFDGTAPLSFATVGVQAAKWTTGRTITLTGDITGTSAAWDGSAALSFATAIGAGVIVDADISAISTSKITGLDTALTNKADKSYVDARTPKITASTTAPSSPVTGDVWIVLP